MLFESNIREGHQSIIRDLRSTYMQQRKAQLSSPQVFNKNKQCLPSGCEDSNSPDVGIFPIQMIRDDGYL